jgi:hypothetical protein
VGEEDGGGGGRKEEDERKIKERGSEMVLMALWIAGV